MSNYASLIATINANIKQNNNQEITGQILNSVLNQMVTALSTGYLFKGVAETTTNPGSPDERVFYLGGAGTYSYFGQPVIGDGHLAVFWYDSSWHSAQINIAPVLDIVNNLQEGGVDKVLSAEMGHTLYGYIFGSQPELNNGNLVAADYKNYGSGSSTRGYIILSVEGSTQYKGILSVKSGSTLKYAITLRSSATMTQAAVYDSGWITAGQDAEVTQANGTSAVKYIAITATYADAGYGVPTLQEFLANADFRLQGGAVIDGVYQVINAMQTEIDNLKNEVFGTSSQVTITNEDFPADDYLNYTTSSNTTRGYVALALPNPTFAFSLSVAAGSPIKAGIQARDSKVFNGGAAAPYDSGWITPGNSYSTNPSNFSGHGYLMIVTTYVSGNTGIPTLQEVRNNLVFTYSYGEVSASLREQIVSQMKVCRGVMSHRGFHLNGVPENSLDAYRYAGACQFQFAETDFSATSDGHLVLMHDNSINRTMKNKSDYSSISGTINVASKTLAELQAGYVLAATDKRYRRTIPLLEDYFKICKQYGIFPIPEIKETGNSQTTIKAAFDMGCEILGEGNFGFCSFSDAFLDYARSLSEKTPLLYINNGILNSYNTITGKKRNSPLDVWYPQYTNAALTASAIAEYHAAGMKVAAWTIPAADLDAMLKMGVDIINTDEVAPWRFDVGEWERTDVDFSDFTTGGSVVDNALQLTSGQAVSWTGESTWLGGYYLEVIGKGAFTITAPNLSKAISSVDTDTFVFAGLCDNKTMQVTITASAASEIQFISFKHWKV